MTVSVQSIRQSVREVVDPELGGVTIGDLGLVHDVRVDTSGEVIVELLPTFLGCPALSVMAADVRRSAVLAGAASCAVIWRHLPPWDSSLITALGTKQLASLGIAVAVEGQPDPSCPSCGSTLLRQVNPVGATACRAVAWCGGCRSVIDIMGARRG